MAVPDPRGHRAPRRDGRRALVEQQQSAVVDRSADPTRGLPRTHHFAQARSVFAVARKRCDEVFSPPASATIWRLPEAIEDTIEARWEGWLDDASAWKPFFEKIAEVKDVGL